MTAAHFLPNPVLPVAPGLLRTVVVFHCVKLVQSDHFGKEILQKWILQDALPMEQVDPSVLRFACKAAALLLALWLHQLCYKDSIFLTGRYTTMICMAFTYLSQISGAQITYSKH